VTVLIAYCSKYGTTARCARILAERITGQTELVDLRAVRDPDVARFDVILIGGSVYGGKIQRQVPAFCERNRDALLRRHAGIFLCCLSHGERAAAQVQGAFPEWLLAHAFARCLPGGELRYSSLTLADRILVRGLTRSLTDRSLLKIDALESLGDAVNGLPSLPAASVGRRG
jgi:menaquinone-dependent protoporphyrinogen oxidase